MENSSQKSSVTASFHLMWGNYPFPAMLINSDHEIQAVNRLARELGITPGIRCHALTGKTATCPGCKAHGALKKGEGRRHVGYSEVLGQVLDSYWVPLEGSQTLYVHFGNNITEYAKAGLLPEKTADN